MQAAMASNAAGFDLVGCCQRCMERVIEERGLKILLLDEETQEMVSMCYSFTDMLKKDLYLVDQVGNPDRKRQGHLKALLYVRPTEENISLICSELRQPKYAEYLLFFANIVTEETLARLAEADDHEVVKQVHEVFADYYPLHPYAFSVDLDKPLLQSAALTGDTLGRTTDAILSVLLSIRRRPSVRFQGASSACKLLAGALSKKMQSDAGLFEFRRSDECLLLLIDRCDDLVTPLLTQWTYEAMMHEEFGITKHKTKVGSEEINMIPLFDSFFTDNLHSNWGDLCAAVKDIVCSYKQKSDYKGDGSAENLETLKAFMDKMPELRKESIMMGKHTNIAAALSKAIKERNLLEVSELEQEMSCGAQQRDHLERLLEMIDNDMIYTADVLRLVLLYMIRWERNPNAQIDRVRDALNAKRTLNTKQEGALAQCLGYGGEVQRASDLFDEKKFTSIIKKAVKGMQDVENVYTQHEPILKKTIQAAVSGKLSPDAFPYSANAMLSPAAQRARDWKPKEVVVFIVGGITHEVCPGWSAVRCSQP
eukprot:TRINITY_DN12870_c0_g1_i4.p1 TRINITY_DN12870_c0_g1~~TRINITY_DN12870_c0_g1_i4.p1  ORF type:complete len:538 (+),score=237.67 TRINITY_DN12870_c0_g1_i4:107-1720(+)